MNLSHLFGSYRLFWPLSDFAVPKRGLCCITKESSFVNQGQNHHHVFERDCARSEVSAIDTPSKPKINVQESIENAKVYCKQNPDSFVSLRDYSGGIYNQTCTDFAAEQHATDPTFKIGSD
jgi:hypothetical protein